MADVPTLITQLAAKLRAKNPSLGRAEALTTAVTSLRTAADRGPMPQRAAVKAALAEWDRLKRGAVSLATERRRNAIELSTHAPWREDLHPRAGDGRFGSGSGHNAAPRIDYTRRTPRKAKKTAPPPARSGSNWQAGISGGARARSAGHAEPAHAPEPAHTPAPDPHAGAPEGPVHRQVALSADQNEALMEYTGNSYGGINGALRRGDQPSRFDADTIRHMDAAFGAVPPLTRPITVQRGVFGDGPFPSAPPPMTPGAEFRDNAYTSTSTNLSALFRDDTVIDVNIPAGERVIDINATSGSNYPEENEVLLPRGTAFRVVSDAPAGDHGPRRIVVEVVPRG